MLFCKNSEETLSPRPGVISKTMSDKSKTSKKTAAKPPVSPAGTPPPPEAPVAVAEPPAPPRKIYPIVKYGDPILEKPTTPIKKFDAELEALVQDMFASMY